MPTVTKNVTITVRVPYSLREAVKDKIRKDAEEGDRITITSIVSMALEAYVEDPI